MASSELKRQGSDPSDRSDSKRSRLSESASGPQPPVGKPENKQDLTAEQVETLCKAHQLKQLTQLDETSKLTAWNLTYVPFYRAVCKEVFKTDNITLEQNIAHATIIYTSWNLGHLNWLIEI
ncbi:hypothetical protein H0H87_001833, partial [Tephrocybe sp. NHM501043]